MKINNQTKSQKKNHISRYYRLLLYILTLLLFTCPMSYAQKGIATIYGKITSQNSGESIPFATISILKKSKALGTINTDIDGNYNAALRSGTYDFEATFTGYTSTRKKNTTVSEGDSLQLNFQIKEKGDFTMGSSAIQDQLVTNKSEEVLNAEVSTNDDEVGNSPKINAPKLSIKNKKQPIKKAKPRISPAKYAVYRNKNAKSPFRYPVARIPMVLQNESLNNLKQNISNGPLGIKEYKIVIEDLVNSLDYHYSSPTSKSTPFEIYTELFPCPWNEQKRLLHVGIQTIESDSNTTSIQKEKSMAEDVNISVEFNPAYVTDYRLVGYEDYFPNLLSYQTDPSMDATMRSGQSLTAIYEFTPTQNKFAKENQKLLYQNRPKSLKDNNELGAVQISYRSPSARKKWTISRRINRFVKSIDDIEEKTILAVSLAEIAMKLKGSPYIKSGSTNDILKRIRNIEELSDDGNEILKMVEKIQLLEAQK